MQSTVYEATASVIIQPNGGQQILGQANQDAQNAARNVDTQVAVLRSKAISDAVKKQLGHRPQVAVLEQPDVGCREHRPRRTPTLVRPQPTRTRTPRTSSRTAVNRRSVI